MTVIELRHLSVERAGHRVLNDVTLTINRAEFVGLIGPNGAGKTTLLKAALGLVPASGKASLAELSPRERARTAAYMPQGRDIAWAMPVEAVVALGRMAWAGDADADRRAVEDALTRLDLAPLRDRPATSLSGGEQARVLLARALAQQTPVLLADEPTAGLDPAAQIGAMALFRGLADAGGSVIASVHDLGLAARYCTRLIALHAGRVVADGAPRDVLTSGLLADVFGIRAFCEDTSDGLIFQPLSQI